VYQVDAQAAKERLRTKYLYLLHESKPLEVAVKDQDQEYLTTHQILIRDGKGFWWETQGLFEHSV
jgi:hypothetical protein